jgi:hypothetical protein
MLAILATLASLPWLQGFEATAVADRGEPQLTEIDPLCPASAYGQLRLSADLARPPGDETVTASFTDGVVVVDREQHEIAHAQGFDCHGSADELIALAAGDASLGFPVIALVAATGGHNESITWLTLYRVDSSGELVALFTGIVERHIKHQTRTGSVIVIPGGLIYRPPVGNPQIWMYDQDAGHYVQQLSIDNVA